VPTFGGGTTCGMTRTPMRHVRGRIHLCGLSESRTTVTGTSRLPGLPLPCMPLVAAAASSCSGCAWSAGGRVSAARSHVCVSGGHTHTAGSGALRCVHTWGLATLPLALAACSAAVTSCSSCTRPRRRSHCFWSCGSPRPCTCLRATKRRCFKVTDQQQQRVTERRERVHTHTHTARAAGECDRTRTVLSARRRRGNTSQRSRSRQPRRPGERETLARRAPRSQKQPQAWRWRGDSHQVTRVCARD